MNKVDDDSMLIIGGLFLLMNSTDGVSKDPCESYPKVNETSPGGFPD